ncbi:hypothetical protein [Enterococcus hirae]|nr:hypothetical protein [Enterococcus hirae]
MINGKTMNVYQWGQPCGVTKDVINGQQLKEVLQFDYLDSQNQ